MAGRASLALGCKYCAGDLIAQNAASRERELDRRRAGYFFGFGCYYGVVNYAVFRALAMSAWPAAPWPKALFSACFDGLVHVPLSFYPQFYFVREVVTSSERRTLRQHFEVGLRKYATNWREDILASAAVFVPLGIANFRYVPLVWRTPFLSLIGMVFPIVLSLQRGATDD
ncbi:hypothetical protein AB1Y20_021549 [Prymnesium parvum]|uniref:Uncharacterized protein n=1 Tax=Prymnesium parvum TaxID=97485 RepID=A0AB34JJU1_PRYPA